MSISNALHFHSTSRLALQGATLPSLTARQEYGLIMSTMAVFLAGSAGVALFALSALGQ
jgi:hypothetical protein